MSEPPLTNRYGLVHIASHKLVGIDVDQHGYQFTPHADQDTVRVLLACISDVRELTFFDAEHPQLSDPGAYISIVRSSEGLLAQCANHGWSSPWIPIAQDEAVRYLHLCMPFHTPPSSEQLTFTEPSNWRRRRSVSKWRWSLFRRYLNKRLARAV
jgi:hypothetical protein